MSSQTPHDLIRAYCDGELEPARVTEFEETLRADPALADRVAFEHALRVRISRAMQTETPVALATRVRDAIAAAEPGTESPSTVAGDPASDRRDQPDAGSTRKRSFFAGPQRANVFAVAATLAVVAGAVLFGIFGRPIDSVTPRTSPVAEIAQFVSTEHIRCAGDLGDRDHKVAWKATAAAERLRAHLGTSVPIIDLEAAGFRFVGAGACKVPGEPASAHLVYTRPERGRDGCPQTMLSLFVVPDHGQFAGSPRLNPARWGWTQVGDRPECRQRVACASDGSLVYFLVCCNEDELPRLAALIGHQAARLDNGQKP